MAAAIGAGLPVTEAAGNMIIDIGGGTTDIAVISLAGIVYSRSLRVAGDAMDEAIILYMKREHNLLIGERTAEQIKFELGSATPLDEPMKMEVKGRHVTRRRADDGHDQRRRRPRGARRAAACHRPGRARRARADSAGTVRRHLRPRHRPHGGGALLQNLDERLRDETGLPVLVAENPLSSVVLGAGMMLSDLTCCGRSRFSRDVRNVRNVRVVRNVPNGFEGSERSERFERPERFERSERSDPLRRRLDGRLRGLARIGAAAPVRGG